MGHTFKDFQEGSKKEPKVASPQQWIQAVKESCAGAELVIGAGQGTIIAPEHSPSTERKGFFYRYTFTSHHR